MTISEKNMIIETLTILIPGDNRMCSIGTDSYIPIDHYDDIMTLLKFLNIHPTIFCIYDILKQSSALKNLKYACKFPIDKIYYNSKRSKV